MSRLQQVLQVFYDAIRASGLFVNQ